MEIIANKKDYNDLLDLVRFIMQDSQDNYSREDLDNLSPHDGAFTGWADAILEILGIGV